MNAEYARLSRIFREAASAAYSVSPSQTFHANPAPGVSAEWRGPADTAHNKIVSDTLYAIADVYRRAATEDDDARLKAACDSLIGQLWSATIEGEITPQEVRYFPHSDADGTTR